MVKRYIVSGLCVLILLFAQSSEATFISITTEAAVSIQGNTANIQVGVINKGDEPAYRVKINADIDGKITTGPLRDILEVDDKYTETWTASVDFKKPGTYPLILRVEYADKNLYPFTALSFINVVYQGGANSKVGGEPITSSLIDRGALSVKVKNLDNVEHKIAVRLVLPLEIATAASGKEVAVKPGSEETVFFDLKNISALPGSNYGVYSILEYEHEGRHYTNAVTGSIKIVEKKETASDIYKWPLIGVAVVLSLIVLYLSLGVRKHGAAYILHQINRLREYKHTIADLCVLLAIVGFFISYFEPKYILSPTITTGGDTASHYYTAKYLAEVLLPKGQIIGWMQGNYAGFPIFQFYFPLPFIIMAALSIVIPLQIAFKLVTILGIFLLPLSTYFSLRLLRYVFPVPIFGALFMLPFLFMEANSMWGGNILSTLAGELTYSLGFSLSILFIGLLYRGITSETHVVKNAVLIALIGLSHGYTLLFSGFASLFFLITAEDFWRKFRYLFKVHVLGFMLMGLWILPLLFNLPYTTRYNFVWIIGSLFEVFPVILLPFIAIALLGRVVAAISAVREDRGGILRLSKDSWYRLWERLDNRIYYLWFCAVMGAFFYFVAYRINVVDIRFLPFLQIFLMMVAAVELGRLVQVVRVQWLFPVALSAMVFVWVGYHEKSIKSWISWNYTGFEGKPLWPVFSSINSYLQGAASDPRVLYEHSSVHNDMGTVRIFESLPLFSGRSTMEGLYMQSSISSPFIFYIQSETSQEISCPLPDYSCSTLNLKDGMRHLRMFNVRDFIVRSDEVKAEMKRYPEFILKQSFGQYDIYELSTNENRYVTPLQYEPVLYETENWKDASYRWFKNSAINDVHVVFTKKATEDDLKRFRTVIRSEGLSGLPMIAVDTSCKVKEEIKEEEIAIKTDCINKPLLIKMSYHPNWRVEGADRVYLVSPSFMLIFPDKEDVRLKFSRAGVEYAGIGLTFAALFLVMINLPLVRENRLRRAFDEAVKALYGIMKEAVAKNRLYSYVEGNRLKVLVSVSVTGAVLAALFIWYAQGEDAGVLYAKGLRYFDQNDYAKARGVFGKIVENYPESSTTQTASYYYAITYFKEENHQKTIEAFQRLIAHYPESSWIPEAYYHIGLSHARLNNMEKAKEAYNLVIDQYPASRWAKYSRDRLSEVSSGQPERREGSLSLYNQAMKYYDAGNYEKARMLFAEVTLSDQKTKLAEYAAFFQAICLFKEQKFKRAIRKFEKIIREYPQSDYVPEAYYHIGLSYRALNNPEKAKSSFEKVIKDFPESRWTGYSEERLKEVEKAP